MNGEARNRSMQQTLLYGIAAVLLLSVGTVAGTIIENSNIVTHTNLLTDNHEQQGSSPYAGQQKREIKYLPSSDVKALRHGKGGALGGLAKPAELNSYPGPRHVLDNSEELNLTEEQETEIQNLFDEMKAEAQPVGKDFLEVERKIDNAYANENMTEEQLETLLNRSGELYGQLRYVHLKYHFQTKDILTEQQIQKYSEVRGYASGNHEDGHGGHM
jgi:Spy/CpxP family protein refolding chaperone